MNESSKHVFNILVPGNAILEEIMGCTPRNSAERNIHGITRLGNPIANC